MKTTFTYFLLAFTCFWGKSIACDCIFIPNFCETITFGNNGEIGDYLNIYRVKVLNKQADGMTVQVEETYHGENNTAHDIFINNGDGADCNMFTDQFLVDQELIIAAQRGGDKWHIGACGVTFLEVENGQVIGQITPNLTELPLAEFSSLSGCGDLSPSATNEPSPTTTIIVEPTLATDWIKIRTKGLSSLDIQLSIFDIGGRLIHRTTISKEIAASIGENIGTGQWSDGIYFINIIAGSKKKTFKFAKMGSR